MEPWQTGVLVVVSLVAGAILPALVQLTLTLRSSRAALERASVRLDRTLDAAAATAERLDKATAGIDERRIAALMESVESLARTVNQAREAVRVASAVSAAVGPAVGAAVRAWRAGLAEPGDGTVRRGGADRSRADGEEERS
jgi:ABC-type transporter Mla subunit MlaD